MFQNWSTLPHGTSNSVTGIAVDSATGTVYTANEFGGTVTAFNESSGTVLQDRVVASFVGGSFPAGLLLDATHARLFVSISTRFASATAAGWLLVLNESTFAVQANVSFPSAPGAPFEPSFLAYDGPSGQLFVENASMGELAVVNVTRWSVSSYIICPVPMCVEHGYGLLDVPQFHTLVVPTCTPELWLVNTTNDSTRATITGPNGTIMAWAAYDTVDRTLWVENYTYTGPRGSFLKVNLTTLAILSNVPGAPPRGTAIAYDALDNVLVATNLNGSEEIADYSAVNALRLANYSAGSTGVHPFVTLAFDPATRTAIAAGPGNGTTIAFSVPALKLLKVYSSFELSQTASAVDAATGEFLVAGTSPTTVRAATEATGAPVWETPLPSTANPSAVVVDPTGDLAIVADAADGTLLSYHAATGAPVGQLSLGATAGPCALALDGPRQLLYVGESNPPAVAVVNLTRNVVVGSLSLPGEMPCGLALDPVTGDLLALSSATNSVLDLKAPGLAENASWSVPGTSVALAVNSSGVALVLDNSGAWITLMNGTTGAISTSIVVGALGTSLALDAVDDLLFVATSDTASVRVIATDSASYVGSLAAPAPVAAPSFDAVAGALVAPTAATGQVSVSTLVPVPSAPVGITGSCGNNTATAFWGPPYTSGPYPVNGYVVAEHPVGGAPGGQRLSVNASSARLYNLTDGQLYRLTVAAHSAAGLGTSVASELVRPLGIPYPPNNVTATAQSANSISVSWSRPVALDGAPVLEYAVEYQPTGSTSVAQFQYVASSLFVTLPGLSSATNYTITVRAGNVVGLSNPSMTVHAVTASAPPSAAILTFVEVGVVLVAVAVSTLVFFRRRARSRRARDPAETPNPAEAASDTTLPSDPPV